MLSGEIYLTMKSNYKALAPFSPFKLEENLKNKNKEDDVQKRTQITAFCISGDNIPWWFLFYLHI